MNCCHCKYWGQSQDDIDDGAPLFITNITGHQPCHHSHVGGGSYFDESRQASDALNSSDEFTTGPFFGCKHYKDKR